MQLCLWESDRHSRWKSIGERVFSWDPLHDSLTLLIDPSLGANLVWRGTVWGDSLKRHLQDRLWLELLNIRPIIIIIDCNATNQCDVNAALYVFWALEKVRRDARCVWLLVCACVSTVLECVGFRLDRLWLNIYRWLLHRCTVKCVFCLHASVCLLVFVGLIHCTH